MNQKLLQSIVGVALVALAVTVGCGGAEGDEAPPSKEAFIREANFVCIEGVQEKEELVAESIAIREKAHGQVPQERVEQYNSELMEIYEGEAERLAELTPPAGHEKKIEAMVEAMNEGAERYKANPEGGGVPFMKPDRLAQAYGLDKCIV